jgi:hypothetical protein
VPSGVRVRAVHIVEPGGNRSDVVGGGPVGGRAPLCADVVVPFQGSRTTPRERSNDLPGAPARAVDSAELREPVSHSSAAGPWLCARRPTAVPLLAGNGLEERGHGGSAPRPEHAVTRTLAGKWEKFGPCHP